MEHADPAPGPSKVTRSCRARFQQVATPTAPALSCGEAAFVAHVEGALACDPWHETWDEQSVKIHTSSAVSKGIASSVVLGEKRKNAKTKIRKKVKKRKMKNEKQ